MSNISGIIKSIQSIMWQDTGLNGDAQRIEVLRLKPFDEISSPLEIINEFGSKEKYLQAV